MADSEHTERRTEQQEHGNAYGWDGLGRRGNAGGVAGKSGASGNPPAAMACREGIPDGLGDASGAGLEERGREPGDAGPKCAATERAGHAERLGRHQSSETEIIGGTVNGDHSAIALNLQRSEAQLTAFGETADWVLTRPQRVGDRPGLRPVERGAFPLAHGSAQRVGRLCADCIEETEIADHQNLRSLRKVPVEVGGCISPQVLQQGLHGEGIRNSSRDKGARTVAGAASFSKPQVRTMRNRKGRVTSAPQGRKSEEQRDREHYDPLSQMSRCDPSRACERCGQQGDLYGVSLPESRVGRLRGYGDGIVAPAAQAFIEAYMKL